MGESKRDVLEYIKTCIKKLAGRNFNLVLSDDETIKFIHVPFERHFSGLGEFGCDYTTNEFARYLRMYYEHIEVFIEYIDPVILAGLKPHEEEWISKCMKSDKERVDNIEIGPQLRYTNINEKTPH